MLEKEKNEEFHCLFFGRVGCVSVWLVRSRCTIKPQPYRDGATVVCVNSKNRNGIEKKCDNATEYRYRQNLGCDNASEYKHHQKESMDCEELLRVHTSCHWKPRNRIYKCM